MKRRNLGEVLRTYRIVRESNLREMAQAIGISAATLMRIEHGYEMDASTLLKLVAWLMAESPETQRKAKR